MIELVAFYGHHKCGTTWIRGIFEGVSKKCGFNFKNFTTPSEFGGDLEKFISQNHIQAFAFVNAEYDKIIKSENCRAIHVIRDPRDVVVSAYFSHRYSHAVNDGWQRLTLHREQLEKVDIDEGLMLEIDFSSLNFNRMNQWNYADSNILEIKMEDLLVAEKKSFITIFSFLDLYPHPLTESDLESILDAESFIKKTKGRKPGEENQEHHFRKGISGDWKNYFNEKHKDHFKSKYQFLLEKLGYERNDDW
jgi:hypothetical protein